MCELDTGTGEELTAERIAAIKCPATCLVGDLTPKPLVNATDRLLDILPQVSRTTIEGAAHAIHFDRPAEFVQAVQRAAAVDPSHHPSGGDDHSTPPSSF